MARQASIEKWRSRAQDAEADRDHAIEILRGLLDIDREFKDWSRDRKRAKQFVRLFP